MVMYGQYICLHAMQANMASMHHETAYRYASCFEILCSFVNLLYYTQWLLYNRSGQRNVQTTDLMITMPYVGF